jgi:uncharacterized protein (TIGR03435 family)
MMRAIGTSGLFVLLACVAFGQPAAASRAFDVASVRPSQLAKSGGKIDLRESVEPTPGSLTMRKVSLSSCIQWAYEVKRYQVSGPGWLSDERYDVVAKTASPAKEDELRRMLQALLTERFKLRLHGEQKVLPTYALVAAKNGPKFRESETAGEPAVKVSKLGVTAERTPMAQFADLLAGPLRNPVVDRTGLQGCYDFTLDLAGFPAFGKKEKRREPDDDLIAFVSGALQEQLGLKLEGRSGPAEVLIIDHAEKIPTEN